MRNTITKMTYKAPTFDVVVIEMEEGIAAGSAQVRFRGEGQIIEQEWDEQDQTKDFTF